MIDENQNISAGQKLLLQWHFRFGHLNFPASSFYCAIRPSPHSKMQVQVNVTLACYTEQFATMPKHIAAPLMGPYKG
jgi:hypothetical protein